MTRYNFNEHYFDNIDSSDKAYWIGFIWADGYVCKRDRGNRYEYNLKLELCKEDSKHLETFVKCIDGNYPIKTIKLILLVLVNMKQQESLLQINIS